MASTPPTMSNAHSPPHPRKNAATIPSPSPCSSSTSLTPRWAAVTSLCAQRNGLPTASCNIRRHGNALLGVAPDELRRAPVIASTEEEHTFEFGDNLHTSLAAVIQQAMAIEGEASTEMEVVKRKERQWRHAREQLKPFLDVANLWLAGIAGVPMDEFNYLYAARLLVT